MNIRDLINRMESIELAEGLRLKDIEAQVGQEKDEQKRAQTLMTLAQTNKLPGLYDPVSGYFVSADPDTSRGDGMPGESRPRISATGTEETDALLAKRGLVPPKANTSTFLRKLNPFKSSNQDYDTGVQGGSQAAIARQDKEDEELKQLTDLIPKYKALKDKLATLNGGHAADAVAAKGYNGPDGESVAGESIAEALLEGFSDLFEDGVPPPPNTSAVTTNHNLVAQGKKYRDIHGTEDKEITSETPIIEIGGENIYDVGDLIMDIGLTAVFAGAGTLLAPVTAGGSAGAAAAVAAPRVIRIARAIASWSGRAKKNFTSAEAFKKAVSEKAKAEGARLHKEMGIAVGGTAALNVGGIADKKAGTGVYDYIGGKAHDTGEWMADKYHAGKRAVGLNESMRSLSSRLRDIEQQTTEGALRRIGGEVVSGAEAGAKRAERPGGAITPRDPLADVLDRLPNQVSTEFRVKPRPDISDAEWRQVPDNIKGGVGAWLKANPGKTLAAATAAVLAASQIGGGQGQRNGPTANQVATAPNTSTAPGTAPANPNADAKTSEPTTYQIKPGDNLSNIAKRNNVSVAELMAANPSIKDPNKIRAGATLTIPTASGKPTYDQGVGSTPVNKPADATATPADTTADDTKAAEEAKKKSEIEATQKEIDDIKQKLAALIVDLEKSEDEDNIRQLKDLESQLDDLEEIKNLPAGKTAAMSNVDQQIDKDKQNPQNNPAAASLSNAPGSKAATTPIAGDKEGAAMNSKGEISYPGKGPNYKPEYDPQHTGNPLYKQEPATDKTKSGVTVSNWNEGIDTTDELQRWLKIARG
jgi:LysM repeat protein